MEHALHKPAQTRMTHEQRRKALIISVMLTVVLAGALIAILVGCAGSSGSNVTVAPPPAVVSPLSAADVGNIIQAAAMAANLDTMVIAVVDRGGNVLGVFRKPGYVNGATDIGNFGMNVDVNDVAVGLARTGAYFSNDQAPLSSRTVRFISGIHFPPGVANAPNADLYGIENTNRGCTLSNNYLPGRALNPSLSLEGTI